jgi:hypothetical protein
VHARLVERVGDLAEDIDLLLPRGRVAYPYRPRALEARQPVELPLRQPALAGDPVHDLDVIRIAGHCPQKPRPPLVRFFEIAGLEERKQGQRRVPQPAMAVVPVADTADRRRYRRSRRRDDPSRRPIRQPLQHNERLQHLVTVRTFVAAPRRPLRPELVCLAQRLVGIDDRRDVGVRREPGQRERHPLAGCDLERRHGRHPLALSRRGVRSTTASGPAVATRALSTRPNEGTTRP